MNDMYYTTFGRVDGSQFDDELYFIEDEDNDSVRTFYSVERQTDGRGFSVLKQVVWDNPDPKAKYPKCDILEKDIASVNEAIQKANYYYNER